MNIPNKRNGFTLVELLVTITIIAALAAVAVLASRSAQLSASKVADMSNLRSLSTAAMAAGTDNAGRLPTLHHPESPSYAPYWLQPKATLLSYGISKEGCYAPTRGIEGGAPEYTWWYKFDSGTPTHYNYFANDGKTKSSGWCSQGSVVKPTEAEYRGSTPYQDIVKDSTKAFVRSVTDDAWYTVLWTGICRDYGGSRVGAIMQSGKVLGINTMYVDGHAEWVPIKKIKIRYTASGLTLLW